jgi:hypothetical protein
MSPTTPGAENPTAPATAAVRHTDNLPLGQLELARLGLASSKEWDASPLGDLLFKTKAQYQAQTKAYMASLDLADEAGDSISPNAEAFRKMDKVIDKNLRYVKAYLAEDHNDDKGKSFYDEFGIVKVGKNWILPIGQGARAKALKKLLAALVAHGYDDRKFGTAFWQPIYDKYAPLVGTSGEDRGDASEAVGVKNAQEEPLREVLRALIHLIRANYPDEATCKGVLRAFGFQKEVY